MEVKTRTGRTVLACLAWAAATVIALYLIMGLLAPKYMTDIQEGALIAEYYEEKIGHDVVFIGDCEVYENFSPDVLWREYGVTS